MKFTNQEIYFEKAGRDSNENYNALNSLECHRLKLADKSKWGDLDKLSEMDYHLFLNNPLSKN